ncbi:MAG: hypothetical protein O7E52_19990 [Candidatus Poribacteria bacterium]|nr:hypothetical protein [Candidatus Poribacteria bacterium]
MPFSVKLLQGLDKLEPDLKSVMFDLLGEIERNQEESVTKREFVEFAQKTDENFQHVWKAIGELAEAQQRTEQRVEALAEAQQRTEQRIGALAEAQERTEEEIRRLTRRVDNLAVRLTQKIDDLAVQVGGLSNTIGYGIEDKSYPLLKKVIQRDFGVDVESLFRKNIVYSRDHFDEINIYGEGVRSGEKVYIVGECKAQFGANDVKRYAALLERVGEHLGGPIVSLTLAYHYHPQAEESLKAQGIKYYWSYELLDSPSP